MQNNDGFHWSLADNKPVVGEILTQTNVVNMQKDPFKDTTSLGGIPNNWYRYQMATGENY